MVFDKIKILVIKTAGKFLKASGFLLHKNKLYFLGHYLEGSGKHIILDKRFYDLIRQQVLQNIQHLENVDYSYNQKIIQKVFETGFLPVSPVRETKLGLDLYHSVGKFKIFIGSGFIYLEDYYEFYKWCGNTYHFKNNCDCHLEDSPEDLWSEVRILDLRHHLFKDEFVDSICNKSLHLEHKFPGLQKLHLSDFISRFFYGYKRIKIFSSKLVICISSRSFEVITFDKVFSEIGKPFFTFARIPFTGEIK